MDAFAATWASTSFIRAVTSADMLALAPALKPFNDDTLTIQISEVVKVVLMNHVKVQMSGTCEAGGNVCVTGTSSTMPAVATTVSAFTSPARSDRVAER
jgi:hypothetical protein